MEELIKLMCKRIASLESKCSRLEEMIKKHDIEVCLKYFDKQSPEKKETKEPKGVQPECEQCKNPNLKGIHTCGKDWGYEEYKSNRPSPAPEKTHETLSFKLSHAASKRQISYNELAQVAEQHFKEKFNGRVNWISDAHGSRKDFIIALCKELFSDQKEN